MNDADIRQSFHRKRLRRYHDDQGTLVVDELGLRHGSCRADIAVINGQLLGYEIKSDRDDLSRLPSQVAAYNAVFDRIAVVVGPRHLETVHRMVPDWWGIVHCVKGSRGSVHFCTQRRSLRNPRVDLFSLAQLLWRSEAAEILQATDADPQVLRQPRRVLYQRLATTLSRAKLGEAVRLRLRSRQGWRCPRRPSRCGGLSRPTAR